MMSPPAAPATSSLDALLALEDAVLDLNLPRAPWRVQRGTHGSWLVRWRLDDADLAARLSRRGLRHQLRLRLDADVIDRVVFVHEAMSPGPEGAFPGWTADCRPNQHLRHTVADAIHEAGWEVVWRTSEGPITGTLP